MRLPEQCSPPAFGTDLLGGLASCPGNMPANADAPDVVCWHVEHTFVEAVEIGRAYQSALADDCDETGPSALKVATCQRILCIGVPADMRLARLPQLVRSRGQVLNGTRSALTLLAEIAVGLRSRLIGERLILHQVTTAVAQSRSHPAVHAIGRQGVSIARALRSRHGFWAQNDYAWIAFRLLDRTAVRMRSMRPVLVVAGSGMLATSVLAAPGAAWYDDVIVITRSPGRCARRLRGIGSSAIAMTAERVVDAVAATPFRLIVASGVAMPEYRSALRQLSALPTCLAIVDLSGDPLFESQRDAGVPYVTMYDDAFDSELAVANDLMRVAAANVAAALGHLLAYDGTDSAATSVAVTTS